jgi:hypothetical protein
MTVVITMNKNILILILITLIAFSGCKKEADHPEDLTWNFSLENGTQITVFCYIFKAAKSVDDHMNERLLNRKNELAQKKQKLTTLKDPNIIDMVIEDIEEREKEVKRYAGSLPNWPIIMFYSPIGNAEDPSQGYICRFQKNENVCDICFIMPSNNVVTHEETYNILLSLIDEFNSMSDSRFDKLHKEADCALTEEGYLNEKIMPKDEHWGQFPTQQ